MAEGKRAKVQRRDLKAVAAAEGADRVQVAQLGAGGFQGGGRDVDRQAVAALAKC